jgi:hypothetical protein
MRIKPEHKGDDPSYASLGPIWQELEWKERSQVLQIFIGMLLENDTDPRLRAPISIFNETFAQAIVHLLDCGEDRARAIGRAVFKEMLSSHWTAVITFCPKKGPRWQMVNMTWDPEKILHVLENTPP